MSYLEKTVPLWELLERVVREEGLELYDVERQAAGLRITIAVPKASVSNGVSAVGDTQGTTETSLLDGRGEGEVREGRSGVSSGDCSKVCRRLMVHFEAEGPEYGLSNEPQLEVSSPGIDRVLRTEEHFISAVGERVKVLADAAAEGDKKKKGPIIGALTAFANRELVLLDEKSNEEVRLSLDGVKKASIAFKF